MRDLIELSEERSSEPATRGAEHLDGGCRSAASTTGAASGDEPGAVRPDTRSWSPLVDWGMPAMQPHPGRRAFLALTGAVLGAAPLHALSSRAAVAIRGRAPEGGRTRDEAGYGPLRPVRDETTGLPLLHLPGGFRYLTFGWTGDPLADGRPTPPAHDGMAAFAAAGSRIRLIRNHEVRSGGAFADRPLYDEMGGGGTTTIEFDTATGVVHDAWTSLAGTAVNCAGGPTPWGSWLTCEETVSGPDFGPSLASSLFQPDVPDYRRPHGYVFDVPADGAATAEPLLAMGRFVHEAVSIDPATGIVYETEDRGAAGFYRFLPNEAGNLAAGGRLEMLAVAGAPRSDLRKGQTAGTWRPVSWVPIEDPDPAEITDHSVFEQGAAGGGATFARLEGTWYGGERIFIVSTDGGEAEAGQVWEYDPGRERLRLIFESPGKDVLDMPDNICVSPRGGAGALRGWRHGQLRPRSGSRRPDLSVRQEQRRPRRLAERLRGRLPRPRVRRRHLQPGRPLALLQRPDPRDHVRGDRSVGRRQPLVDCLRGKLPTSLAVPARVPGAIPVTDRPHVDGDVELWTGDARAHWEGDTLVVDTTNFNDRAMIVTSSNGGRLKGLRSATRCASWNASPACRGTRSCGRPRSTIPTCTTGPGRSRCR